ncbi:stress protein [Pontibacillus halophilus JSM 076056 = DSM 19796]|uniref:Stress protein n=1 Tax=Pontibacillus halophilus JSM 076056 = DSM 19796 TaxID=1385510 RepID=A0A0A5GHU9_9BACI|nr:TerD family protein [Pontibacillus halophilus]KGX90690.1 stress protein [Pontibacillus halophilus JSM 076056 = DSM 19796]
MAITLEKGQRVDLTKGNPGLSKVMVGLGWDPVQTQKNGKGGLLGSLFGGGSKGPEIDCDASVIMLQDDKFVDKSDLVYFGKLKSDNGSVQHTGDNLTGEGDGDDEQVFVDLKDVPQKYNKLVFVVNIYDCKRRKQDFGMIENAFIRLQDTQKRDEMLRYNLSDDYSGRTTLIAGELYRQGNEWKFAAVGEGTTDASLSEIVQRYV